MANGQILPPVTWAAVWWLQILHFASTRFHSLCTHMYNSPLLGPRSPEISQNFITDLNGNRVRAQVVRIYVVCMYGWLQSNPTMQFRVWHHLMPSTPSHTNRKRRLEWSLLTYHCLRVLTQVRRTKPSSWCFKHWIFPKAIQLSHEGSSDPRLALSWKSTLVLLLKNVRKIFFKELQNALIDLMRAGPPTTDCTFGKYALCCNFSFQQISNFCNF